ncbi:uncharacterized protein METZ01_LOCUS334158, partial [marine metagenome]
QQLNFGSRQCQARHPRAPCSACAPLHPRQARTQQEISRRERGHLPLQPRLSRERLGPGLLGQASRAVCTERLRGGGCHRRTPRRMEDITQDNAGETI